jgi:hypothetical protein
MLAYRHSTGACQGQGSARQTLPGAVDAAYAKFKDTHEGKNADYIPALAKVDPNVFGIALVTADGKVYTPATSPRSVDPVHLQGVHDGAVMRSRARRHREQHRRRCHRHALQLDRLGRAVEEVAAVRR